MEGLLTQVSTPYKGLQENDLVEVRKPPDATPSRVLKLQSPSDALEVLRNEPNYEALLTTLQYLADGSSGVNITSPSAHTSQLVHTLVSEIVPNYWSILRESDSGRKKVDAKRISDLNLLLICLKSVTGINAIILSLKQAIQQSREPKKPVGGGNIKDVLSRLLEVMSRLLEGDETVKVISRDIWNSSNSPQKQKSMWNEFLSVTAGARILGTCAEADDIVNDLSKDIHEKYWVSDGAIYSKWLAENITHWAINVPLDSDVIWKCCGELLSKSLRLGFNDNIIKKVLGLILNHHDHSARFDKLLGCLASFDQRNFIQGILQLVSREYLFAPILLEDYLNWWKFDADVVSAVAGLVYLVLNDQDSRKTYLNSWLTSSSGAGVGEGIAIRRASVIALSRSENDMASVFEKSLQQFGDQLYIRHTPIMQQEAHTQVLLLSAGYVSRMSQLRFRMIMKSGTHLNAISNRLAASSPRARFLGMVVGEALSSLVDTGDKIMDFKMDEMKTPEAMWYKNLVTVSDTIGPLDPIKSQPLAKVAKEIGPRSAHKPGPPSKPMPRGSKIMSIEEVEDSNDSNGDESDTNDFVPYAKPDSDNEDSDEDPTLITRNKPTVPVYIRDLINYLRDTENYDKQKLALQSAAPLIRRKATFGKEVSSHSVELATLLVGLQDKYDMDNFTDMRQQALIAILIAQPTEMGKWFSKTFFDGDYSISQRAAILTALGLGARELGGLDGANTSIASKSAFPSKALPAAMHKLYADTTTQNGAIDVLSTELSKTMIAPMAAELADKLTGPSILKIRTFSSRMAVEKKRKRPIANSLAKIVAESFFFPLTGRFLIHLRAFGSSRSNVVFQPYLLSLFIKTLSLLLHASGPSTLSLPQMTSEFWDLLLALRTQSIGDIAVAEAMLFGFFTILEINEDKRGLVTENGRQMLETQKWVEDIFGRVGDGGGEEDERIRMLAAGCLVRIREAVEKYQGLLMGDLASFRAD